MLWHKLIIIIVAMTQTITTWQLLKRNYTCVTSNHLKSKTSNLRFQWLKLKIKLELKVFFQTKILSQKQPLWFYLAIPYDKSAINSSSTKLIGITRSINFKLRNLTAHTKRKKSVITKVMISNIRDWILVCTIKSSIRGSSSCTLIHSFEFFHSTKRERVMYCTKFVLSLTIVVQLSFSLPGLNVW